ncbi:DeoR/GlpR family DNA-binding transcription regulator [Rhabdothermincola salaria]|uniref:DeoR/GlpR family DNA-binding transcription regulator n=1 Tax=Rhabdothermincola salaria TaxID=2903142 RepID=UPI001E282A73|nr:DeoR/GlpR family DNA-binding transcription regulator [Rhabdothermincola salaria]MCD9622413.1 DeoR/GlpR family DNA-binding transcription regulator [Rhabdothermincola salaria]
MNPPRRAQAGGQARESRLAWLRARLDADGSVSVADASASLGASAMTIRRDLGTLEALGEVRRTRGGAQAVGGALFKNRSPRNTRAKITIAEKLLAMVPTVGAIAIDSSSTMAYLANLLPAARDLLVVTNGLEAFESLQDRPGVRAVLTGGERDPRTGSLIGSAAAAVGRSYRYDVAFVSSAAVDPVHGACEVTLEEAAMVQAFAGQARRVVLGADVSKLEASAAVISLRWGDIDTVVTELGPDSARVAPLRAVTEVR